MVPPRVFISYSHDSAEHKKWVLDFATTLRNRGIDAALDQWDLKPGDDLPHFMETQLAAAEYVLMICTQKYVDKANAGEGGVGYEKMIVTSSLLSRIDSRKAIPIIRQSGSHNTPTFLQTKLHINFSNDKDAEYNLDELLRVLLGTPLYEKPVIGANPFSPLKNSGPDRISNGIKEFMKIISLCYDRSNSKYVMYSNALARKTMHRLVFERYAARAEEEHLIVMVSGKIYLTEKGIAYLVDNEIIIE